MSVRCARSAVAFRVHEGPQHLGAGLEHRDGTPDCRQSISDSSVKRQREHICDQPESSTDCELRKWLPCSDILMRVGSSSFESHDVRCSCGSHYRTRRRGSPSLVRSSPHAATCGNAPERAQRRRARAALPLPQISALGPCVSPYAVIVLSRRAIASCFARCASSSFQRFSRLRIDVRWRCAARAPRAVVAVILGLC